MQAPHHSQQQQYPQQQYPQQYRLQQHMHKPPQLQLQQIHQPQQSNQLQQQSQQLNQQLNQQQTYHQHQRQQKPRTIEKAFVYGSAAFKLPQSSSSQHSHVWTIYVRGLDHEDMSYFIHSVSFTLHSTFENRIRTIVEPPYEVEETGWGEFDINIEIKFKDETQSTVHLIHSLKLLPPPGTVINTEIPVISEQYDEFVFQNPSPAFAKLISQVAQRKFTDHRLKPFFTTSEFATEEQKAIIKLQAAVCSVESQINGLRAKLFEIDQDINRMHQARNWPAHTSTT